MIDFPLINNPSLFKASHIIDELIKHGIERFFVSPGMRNAPLMAALHAHPKASIELGMDERAHSFKALGYSKDNEFPACLVCTSGTALANYYPAVLEAHKSETPLIILSADRPYQKVLGGDNQTIEQNNIYQQFVIGHHNLHKDNLLNRKKITEVINTSLRRKGPIHFNIPFEEPLDSSAVKFNFSNELSAFNKRTFKAILKDQLLQTDEIQDAFYKSKRPLIVIGELPSKAPKDNIIQFLKNYQGLKYIDVSSGLKYQFNLSDYSLPGLDHPEVFGYLNNYNPDFILHLGGRIVSKFYYKFLESTDCDSIFQINNLFQKTDPSFKMIEYKTCPDYAVRALEKDSSDNDLEWDDVVCFVRKKRKLIEQGPLSFPQLSKRLIEASPEHMNFYLGNSTTIRSFDSFSCETLKKELNIFTHRGVSGIEGFIAASSSVKGPTTLVLGDVSFYHDLNSLYYLQKSTEPYVCVLVNDNGGGIFEQLPIHKDTEVLPYLTSPHEINFGPICQGLGVDYVCVDNIDMFIEQYLHKIKQNRASIIEVKIKRKNNFDMYQKLKTIRL